MWFLLSLNIFAVLVVLVTTIYGFFVHYLLTRSKKLMPELPYAECYFPVIGHSYWFIRDAQNPLCFRNHMSNCGKYYKKGVYFLLGHNIWILTMDHNMMQDVLTSTETLDKGYAYYFMDIITNGILLSKGDKWKKLRKLVNQTFSGKQVNTFMPTLNRYIKLFAENQLKKLSDKNDYEDIQHYIARCASAMVIKSHFGVDDIVNDDNHDQETVQKIGDEILEKRFFKPHLHPNFMFKFTKVYKEIIQLRTGAHSFTENVIETRFKYLKENPNQKSDHLVFIDQLSAVLKELNITPNIKNLQTNSGDIIIGGSDTTSIVTSTILYHLALNQDIQEKVYQEVSMFCGQDSYEPFTRENMNSMTYLDMVWNEGLRWSSGLGIARDIQKDFTGGNYTIPRGATVYIQFLSQFQNPEYYERPTEFYPEHFAPEAVKKRPKMAFIPFSFGPRNCPGKTFGGIMVKAFTAIIIRDYRVETNLPLEKVKMRYFLMSQHIQGYPIRLIPRHP